MRQWEFGGPLSWSQVNKGMFLSLMEAIWRGVGGFRGYSRTRSTGLR